MHPRFGLVLIGVLGVASCFGSPGSETKCPQFHEARCGGRRPAGVPRCACTSYGRPAGEYRLRISAETSQNLPGIDRAAFHAAVVQAASTWNENTNQRHFRVGPELSGFGTLPHHKSDCDALGINFSQVVVLAGDDPLVPSECSETLACASGRCVEDGIATQAVIYILTERQGTTAPPIPWGVGTPDVLHRDLISTLTHEFGHIANLAHPEEIDFVGPGSAAATMSWAYDGSTRRRDLYQYDLDCSRDCATFQGDAIRDLAVYERSLSSTSFGPERRLVSVHAAADIGGAMVPTETPAATPAATGSAEEAFAWSDGTCVRWGRRGDVTTPCLTELRADPGIGPVVTNVPELGRSMAMVLISDNRDYPVAHTTLASHQLQLVMSDDDFLTQLTAPVWTCATMTPWMTCDERTPTPVVTGEPVASAWLDGQQATTHPDGVSLVAWVHQNRTEDAHDREVRLVVGTWRPELWPTPHATGRHSVVGPGLACKNDFAAGVPAAWDCILAVVDVSETMNRVQVERFAVKRDAKHFNVAFDPAGPRLVGSDVEGFATTANRIAMTWHEDRFWLVVRSGEADQPLVGWHSVDGVRWTRLAQPLGYSTIAPSFVTPGPSVGDPDGALPPTLIYAREDAP